MGPNPSSLFQFPPSLRSEFVRLIPGILTFSLNRIPLKTIMKRMDIFCTSRASTAVCSGLDSRPVAGNGSRSGLHDRRKPQIHVPCLSQLPINPRKSSSSCDHNLRRKSSADVGDLRSDFPAGSSARYLLAGGGDLPFIEWFSGDSAEDFPALVPAAQLEQKKKTLDSNAPKSSSSLSRSMTVHECRGLKSPSLNSQLQSPALRTSSSARSRDQVVVLKVSLHCKGCEEKVKKHLSKMEGVTSFSVDFTTKKVTIIGDVTPLAVLASVSKVKHAQLWPSPMPSSSSNDLLFSI